MKRRVEYVVEIDKSTLEWTVVEHNRNGWSVIGRYNNHHDAMLRWESETRKGNYQ